MTPPAFSRSVAVGLLRFAIWIAPHDTHDWGRGMLSELNHVEGNWSALIWSIGGAGVLAKHAIVAMIFPGSHRRAVSTASELFDKEIPMRKTTLAVIASCVVASLLLFLAPTFRQAFRVSLAQWHDIFHVRFAIDGQKSDPELEALGEKAEQDHDAEGLAFVAARQPNKAEAIRLADEAVRLDPNLTWVYAVVAVQWSFFPELDRWVPALQKFDQTNALPYLITAEKIDIDQVGGKKIPRSVEEKPAAWKDAMEAAFRSAKLDTYSSQLKELDRRVLLRYRIDDPFQALDDHYWYGVPTYAVWDSYRYAKSLIESANTLEAQGDRKRAREIYWSVVRFGQMSGPDGGFFIGREAKEACRRLATLSEKDGNKSEASFYASLADRLDERAEMQRASWRSRSRGGNSVPHWNAFLVRLAGFLVLFCGGILVICTAGVVVRSRSVNFSSFRPSPLTLGLAFVSAIGALLSSAVLFVSYWPYSQLLQRFLRTGDDFHLSELSAFLGDTQLPLGSEFSLAGSWYVGTWNVVFFFWFAVTVLCALALLIAVFRHFQTRPRASAAA
jgi:tetratricopeptide (TPR) repeat protein